MFFPGQSSYYNTDSIFQTLNDPISQNEQILATQLSQLGPNPTQMQMMTIQNTQAMITAILTMESALIKAFGDNLKTISNNIGS